MPVWPSMARDTIAPPSGRCRGDPAEPIAPALEAAARRSLPGPAVARRARWSPDRIAPRHAAASAGGRNERRVGATAKPGHGDAAHRALRSPGSRLRPDRVRARIGLLLDGVAGQRPPARRLAL